MATTWVQTLTTRRQTVLPFAAIGTLAIIAGGLLAAIVAPEPTEHAVWAVAYLVLVAGVAQIALGAGQSLLTERPPSPRLLAVELFTWNVGNAAVIAGTVSDTAAVTDAGGLLLVIALALLLGATRGARPGWVRPTYRLVVLIVLISIPIGLILAHLKGN